MIETALYELLRTSVCTAGYSYLHDCFGSGGFAIQPTNYRHGEWSISLEGNHLDVWWNEYGGCLLPHSERFETGHKFIELAGPADIIARLINVLDTWPKYGATGSSPYISSKTLP